MKIFTLFLQLAKSLGTAAAEAAPNGLSMNNVIRLWEGPSLATHAEKASAALLSGHVIAVPTDTLYGLAALAQNNTAIERIYEIKRRSSTKPLAICVSTVEDIYLWGKVTVPHTLLTSLLPGPVTLVFQRTKQLNLAFNPGTDLVGIRIPNEDFIRAVARCCSSPLALTSANISSKASPLCVEEFSELWSKLHAVFDSGHLGEHLESREGSTIVDLSQPGTYRLIRRGIAYEQTSKILQSYDLCLTD